MQYGAVEKKSRSGTAVTPSGRRHTTTNTGWHTLTGSCKIARPANRIRSRPPVGDRGLGC